AETYEEMVRRVLAQIDRAGPITVAQVRDLFQTSRKFALALLEDMDRRKLTRRIGDERIRYPGDRTSGESVQETEASPGR
ncbi:MAG: SelB C-terminal domain-containing protein, partial [Chloroflexia bacterium]